MAERGQRPILLDAGMDQTVPGDALRVSAHIVEGALRRMRGPFRKRSESSFKHAVGVVHARTKTVSKTSNENAETLCVRHNASAVAIVPEFPHRYLEINVLACEIRRTIKKIKRGIQNHMHCD